MEVGPGRQFRVHDGSGRVGSRKEWPVVNSGPYRGHKVKISNFNMAAAGILKIIFF